MQIKAKFTTGVSKARIIVAASTFSVAVAIGWTVSAATMAPDAVMIKDYKIADSLTGKAGDAAAGANTFKNRKLGNCLACHVNSAMPKEQFHGEIGPSLDGVAERYSAGELRAIVVDPKAIFGDHTIMPAFYRVMDSDTQRVAKKFQGKTMLDAQQVEDVVAYLLTLK